MNPDMKSLNAAYALLESAGIASALNLRLCNLAAAQDKNPEEVAQKLVESVQAKQ